MTVIERSVEIAASPERVFHFHDDPANLLRISPESLHVELLETIGPIGAGHRVRLRTRQFGIVRQELLIEFQVYDPPRLLVDVQLKGPFASWRQRREFTAIPGGTRLTDRVEYELPLGILGRLADRLVVARQVRSMFEYRQRRTREILDG